MELRRHPGRNSILTFGRLIDWDENEKWSPHLYQRDGSAGNGNRDWAHIFREILQDESKDALGSGFLYKLLNISDQAHDFLYGHKSTQTALSHEAGLPEPELLLCFNRLAYHLGRLNDEQKEKHGAMYENLKSLTEIRNETLKQLAALRFPIAWALYSCRKEG